MELKKITTKESEFTANGRKYFIRNTISFERFSEYEKLQVKLGFGISFKEIFDQLKRQYSLLNEKKFADCAVLTHNLMAGVAEAADEKRIHPALLMCALMINREDEDETIVDMALFEDKINDWRKEGYDIMSFFVLALNSTKGFREIYEEITLRNLELSASKKAARDTSVTA